MRETIIKDINQIIQEIKVLTDCFYQQKLNLGYNKLNKTIENIMDIVEQLFLYKKSNALLFDENKLINSLTQAMKALEDKDSILLADILELEISMQLQEIERKI